MSIIFAPLCGNVGLLISFFYGFSFIYYYYHNQFLLYSLENFSLNSFIIVAKSSESSNLFQVRFDIFTANPLNNGYKESLR